LEDLLLEPRALLHAEPQVVDEARPHALHVEPRGDDIDVVGRAARREDVAVAITDDAARGGQRGAAHDVLARGGAVLVALHDLELEEARDEAEEQERHRQADPLEAALELAGVGAPALTREAHAAARPAREAHRW